MADEELDGVPLLAAGAAAAANSGDVVAGDEEAVADEPLGRETALLVSQSSWSILFVSRSHDYTGSGMHTEGRKNL